MGDLDKTSIIILVCVTAAVITICLIAIIVYRKKWCRKSKDQPEISGSISSSDIDDYGDQPEISGSISSSDIDDYGVELKTLGKPRIAVINEACKGNHNFRNHSRGSNIWNFETVDKPPVPVVPIMPPPPPDPPNPDT